MLKMATLRIRGFLSLKAIPARLSLPRAHKLETLSRSPMLNLRASISAGQDAQMPWRTWMSENGLASATPFFSNILSSAEGEEALSAFSKYQSVAPFNLAAFKCSRLVAVMLTKF
jgi:hypothetical protein